MRKNGRYRSAALLGALILVLPGGCITPPGGGDKGPPPPPPGPPGVQGGMDGQRRLPETGSMSGRNLAQLLPPTLTPSGPVNDQISYLVQQIAASKDNEKILIGRIQQIEVQLEEKEKALSQTSLGMQQAQEEIRRVREEMENLRIDKERMHKENEMLRKQNREYLDIISKIKMKPQPESNEPGDEELLRPMPLPP